MKNKRGKDAAAIRRSKSFGADQTIARKAKESAVRSDIEAEGLQKQIAELEAAEAASRQAEEHDGEEPGTHAAVAGEKAAVPFVRKGIR